MPAIKAVLFDLDDTLWPIVPVIVRAERLLFDWIREHAPGVAASYSIEEMRARRGALGPLGDVAASMPGVGFRSLSHGARKDTAQRAALW